MVLNINIASGGLPLTLACDICKPKLDIHTKKSSQKKKKKERQKHVSNRCKQYWMNKWTDQKSKRTPGEVLKHNLTRNFLGIELGIKIDCDIYKKRKTNITNNKLEKVTSQTPNPVNLLVRTKILYSIIKLY